MLFSSITFIYAFLPAVLIAYYIAPRRAKNYVLLFFSLVFYFFGEPVYTALLLFSSLSDWLHALYIDKHRDAGSARVALISSIVINLGLLAFFKYADFFISSVNTVFSSEIPLLNVPLPIGISFFTFQTMSYTIDVYRGKAHAQKNLASLATYVCLFPQLVAGPIVRYSDIARELETRRSGIDELYSGILRFVSGLAKKVLIANTLGELCAAFRASAQPGVLFFWLNAVAFSLQIYFDFSGYSDMAIGLGRMFGFTFPENFNYPFISRSITEFWRRWHMTLSSWFRDYVYIPLGGNRVSKLRWLLNIAIVWLLTGLWHGASWSFVLWGAYFGILLVLEKLFILKFLDGIPRFFQHAYVLFAVLFSFVIFNGETLAGVVHDLSGMFGVGGLPFVSVDALYSLRSSGIVLILAAVGSTPLLSRLTCVLKSRRHGAALLHILEPIWVCVLLIVCTAFLIDGSFNPFLYFRF